ncbi:MAG: hypothetical protein ACREER_05445, partial [Alphaproteobacteria bacterium]
LLVTRLDVARRLGAVLATADNGGLAFCEAGATPHIANGLATMTPTLLARSLIRTGAEARGEKP